MEPAPRILGWKYVDDIGVIWRKTEADILREYFPYWESEMLKQGKTSQITESNCIRDWVIVNWATPLWDPILPIKKK